MQALVKLLCLFFSLILAPLHALDPIAFDFLQSLRSLLLDNQFLNFNSKLYSIKCRGKIFIIVIIKLRHRQRTLYFMKFYTFNARKKYNYITKYVTVGNFQNRTRAYFLGWRKFRLEQRRSEIKIREISDTETRSIWTAERREFRRSKKKDVSK